MKKEIMGLHVTYRLWCFTKKDLGTDLYNTFITVIGKKKKENNLLMKFIAEATFQTLINPKEDRHVIH